MFCRFGKNRFLHLIYFIRINHNSVTARQFTSSQEESSLNTSSKNINTNINLEDNIAIACTYLYQIYIFDKDLISTFLQKHSGNQTFNKSVMETKILHSILAVFLVKSIGFPYPPPPHTHTHLHLEYRCSLFMT